MKKIFLMMAVAMTAMLAACGSSNNKANDEAAPAEATADEVAFIRINCSLTVSEENHDKVVALAKELVAASLQDEGVIDYDIMESVSRPGQLLIFETWKDQPSLDKHSASEHFTRLVPQIQELGNLTIKQCDVMKEPNLDPEKPFRLNIMMVTDRRAEYIDIVKSVIEGTVKNDAGCREYDYFNSLTNEKNTLLVEVWDNRASMEAHTKAPHFTEARPKTEGMISESVHFDQMAE